MGGWALGGSSGRAYLTDIDKAQQQADFRGLINHFNDIITRPVRGARFKIYAHLRVPTRSKWVKVGLASGNNGWPFPGKRSQLALQMDAFRTVKNCVREKNIGRLFLAAGKRSPESPKIRQKKKKKKLGGCRWIRMTRQRRLSRPLVLNDQQSLSPSNTSNVLVL